MMQVFSVVRMGTQPAVIGCSNEIFAIGLFWFTNRLLVDAKRSMLGYFSSKKRQPFSTTKLTAKQVQRSAALELEPSLKIQGIHPCP
ncbi:hypothetical protein [Caldibacillus debilis]|uniref:hypothetical protein n=1 Tax=Caldibacillus debilis TaxID=301148 RepID=UPI0012B594F4|nr:hypothetical protein [Caldibacillus debilis]